MDKTIIALVLVCAGGLGYGFWQDANYKVVCTGESKVKAITALKYRSADIVLENGMKIDVNQASLTVGDTFCYKHEQIEVK